MDWFAAPSKKLAGQVKSDDAAATITISSATSPYAANEQADVIGRIALAGNHRAAPITDGSSPKRENAVLTIC